MPLEQNILRQHFVLGDIILVVIIGIISTNNM